jgi:hypothetical protein
VFASAPTTTFNYASANTQFYAPAAVRIPNSAYIISDTNGNGENDSNVVYNSGTSILPDNSNSAASASAPAGVYWAVATSAPDSYLPQERGVRLIDSNGDGKPDIVVDF